MTKTEELIRLCFASKRGIQPQEAVAFAKQAQKIAAEAMKEIERAFQVSGNREGIFIPKMDKTND